MAFNKVIVPFFALLAVCAAAVQSVEPQNQPSPVAPGIPLPASAGAEVPPPSGLAQQNSAHPRDKKFAVYSAYSYAYPTYYSYPVASSYAYSYAKPYTYAYSGIHYPAPVAAPAAYYYL